MPSPTPKLMPLHEIAKQIRGLAVRTSVTRPYEGPAIDTLADEVERWAGHQLLLKQDQAGMVADQLQPLCPILKLVREAERRPRSNDADNATLRVIREGLKSALGAPV